MNKIIEIKNEKIESKCGWSPFDGHKFKGTPVYTIINGEIKIKFSKLNFNSFIIEYMDFDIKRKNYI